MTNITHLDLIRAQRIRKLERGAALPRANNPTELEAYERGCNARKTILAACVTAFVVVGALWVAPREEIAPAVKSAALEVVP